MKYTVKIENTAKTFDTYKAAMTYFAKEWRFGKTYSVTRTDAHGVVFSY